ncbi:unnamed protein product [Bursaphelenchus xylophilus]|uniref:(pine wood nematode) hypothetical protein n=1 Tax=Bursaphelenchus xylophilus TaxID=6326 RepID=A0A1I7RXK1_BURXY|nr:unnamed protein product [Bursaphelenchus xylophilus]CAG9126505.1 unnamed protein product [Bursaphelenchus xylophilus]
MWKEFGMCQRLQPQASYYCPKACGYCKDVEETSTLPAVTSTVSDAAYKVTEKAAEMIVNTTESALPASSTVEYKATERDNERSESSTEGSESSESSEEVDDLTTTAGPSNTTEENPNDSNDIKSNLSLFFITFMLIKLW